MSTEICLLLHKGLDTIVREWTEKVMSDERIQSDAQLTRAQLLDHIPQIIEELGLALANERSEATDLKKGRDHGRLRWRQDFDLKEVLRELMLLRTVLMEHIHHHVTARQQPIDQLSRSYQRINLFMDEEIYMSVEAYLGTLPDARSLVGAVT